MITHYFYGTRPSLSRWYWQGVHEGRMRDESDTCRCTRQSSRERFIKDEVRQTVTVCVCVCVCVRERERERERERDGCTVMKINREHMMRKEGLGKRNRELKRLRQTRNKNERKRGRARAGGERKGIDNFEHVEDY